MPASQTLLYLGGTLGRGDPGVLLLFVFAAIVCYPEAILRWAQSHGWVDLEWKHLFIFVGVGALVYLGVSVFVCEVFETKPEVPFFALGYVLAFRVVVWGVISICGIDKWRY